MSTARGVRTTNEETRSIPDGKKIMNEAKFWVYLREKMRGYWEVSRIESTDTGSGIPDVSYGVPRGNGWIELKYLKTFPKRESTKVRIPCFTEQQKLWLRKRGKISGSVWLFVRVDNEMFLFDWEQAQKVTEWTKKEWRGEAVGHWVVGNFKPISLFRILNKPVPLSIKRERVFKRTDNKCEYCGELATSLDHVIPQSIVKDNSEINLVACCVSCNCKLRDRLFNDLGEKKEWLKNQWLNKIKTIPIWLQEDVDELEGSMRAYVEKNCVIVEYEEEARLIGKFLSKKGFKPVF